ncbi:histone deacetylase, putative [Bodo saltans]|uniref:histone deacetylase n=1 Tax=Bodo saltans TaxID=75058 RepID=A0A0S4J6F0_BODSA|nr:histone deacetylase, putative [Bodo saltans]|eukprot:CUG86774.1 histone deacetylase, putative [Bodo saltans]
MPPPSRFRQAVVSPPPSAVSSGPFPIVLSCDGYPHMSVEALGGAIRSVDEWAKIFKTFDVNASPDVLLRDSHNSNVVFFFSSRFRQAVVSPPPSAVSSGPFPIVLSCDGYPHMSVEALGGAIRSVDEWAKIFKTFDVNAPPDVLLRDSHNSNVVEAVLLTKLMSLVVDKRSGMAVDTLKPNGGYTFDRSSAQESFVLVSPGATGAVYDVQPVGFVYDELMLKHVSPNQRTPEAPIRVEKAHAALVAHPVTGPVLNSYRIPSRQATIEEITLVHDDTIYRRYLEDLVPLEEAVGAPLKTDVYSCEASAAAVRLACGASIDACKWVWDFGTENSSREPVAAFALIRPPGHHCSKDTPSGFCIANNAVVAARSLRHHQHAAAASTHTSSQTLSSHRPRIAIVDLDVHHGEGTQALVEGDPGILYVSTHRYDDARFYPYGPAGSATHVGPHHTVVNIPFDTAAWEPKHCHQVISDIALVSAWERIILPQLERFAPEIIIVSLGFDASYGDPLGKMAVEGGFAVILRKMMQWCSTYSFSVNGGGVPCRGVVCLLEGGYQPSVVAARTCECFEALLRWQDRGTSVEEQQVRNYPKTWADARRRQDRLQSEYEAYVAQAKATSDDKADDTTVLNDDADVPAPQVPDKPSPMVSDDVLWERHIAWVDTTLNGVIDARARQPKR